MKHVIAATTAALLLLTWGPSPALAETSTPPAVTTATAGLNYVALGDSYSAGFGLIPYSNAPAAGCYQADENYPHLIAAALELNLDDRTCSGAKTENIDNTPQTTITGDGIAPIQSDSLNASTNLVTVTIGGNDLGFADVAAFCLANSATGPLLSDLFDNCKDYYVQTVRVGGTTQTIDQLADYITGTVAPRLDDTFALIKQKAPNAKVFVIGYPTLSPDRANVPAGGCFSPALTNSPPYPENAFPFTDTDTAYLHGTEVRLNRALQTAATDSGATFVDTMTATAAHSACAPTRDAYINGITLLTSGEGQGTPTGIPGLSVKLGALHPNPAGVTYLAETITTAINTTLGTQPEPTPIPSAPAPTATPEPSPSHTAAPVGLGTPEGGTPQANTAPTLANTGSNPGPLALVALFALLFGSITMLGIRARRRTTPPAPDRH